jgi:hypothetical protein
MSCVHLKQLYDLCVQQDLKIGGTDLVRLVCKQCGEEEACPTLLMEEYEAQHPEVVQEESADSDEAPS